MDFKNLRVQGALILVVGLLLRFTIDHGIAYMVSAAMIVFGIYMLATGKPILNKKDRE